MKIARRTAFSHISVNQCIIIDKQNPDMIPPDGRLGRFRDAKRDRLAYSGRLTKVLFTADRWGDEAES